MVLAALAPKNAISGSPKKKPSAGKKKPAKKKAASKLPKLTPAQNKQLQITTTAEAVAISQATVDAYFSTNKAGGAQMSLRPPSTVTVQFGSGIDASLHRGLTSVATELLNQEFGKDQSQAQESRVLQLILDLQKHGSKRTLFQFTHLHKTNGKSVVMVESRGATTARGASDAEQTDGKKTLARSDFKVTGHWAAAELSALHEAINLLPESHAKKISGIRFERVPAANPEDPSVGGHYDPNTHTIQMYDAAFGTNDATIGTPNDVLSQAAQSIIHEIGHALDHAKSGKALRDYNEALQSYENDFAKHRRPDGQYWVPGGHPDLSRFKAETKRIRKLENAVDSVTEFSDQRAFKAAARADGAAITQYGENDSGESFAEAYSLFIADPKLLKRLRPRTYAYMLKLMRK